MSNLFQLPCPWCDAKIEISLRQAGQTLSCTACEKDVEAPKLGEIKKLPPSESSESFTSNGRKDSSRGAGRKGSTSTTRNGLFTAGLALAVILGGAGLGLHMYARSLHTPVDIQEQVELTREEVLSLKPEQIYGLATAITKNEELGEFSEPPFLKDNIQGSILTWIAWGLYALGGLGLLMLLGSFFVR